MAHTNALDAAQAGQLHLAMELARRDVDDAQSDPEHLADRLNTLGFVQQLAGDLHQAAASFTGALDCARNMSEGHERRLVEMMALCNLGETACLLGDGARARTALERALTSTSGVKSSTPADVSAMMSASGMLKQWSSNEAVMEVVGAFPIGVWKRSGYSLGLKR